MNLMTTTVFIKTNPSSNHHLSIKLTSTCVMNPYLTAKFWKTMWIWFGPMKNFIWCFTIKSFGCPTIFEVTSPHRNFSNLLACNIVHTFSNKVQLTLSAIPLCSSVSWTVRFYIVPASAKCSLNALLRYSPPQSVWSFLIQTPFCQRRYASYRL